MRQKNKFSTRLALLVLLIASIAFFATIFTGCKKGYDCYSNTYKDGVRIDSRYDYSITDKSCYTKDTIIGIVTITECE